MRIRWTEPAVQDFTHLCDYSAAEFGRSRARRTALQIYEAVEKLVRFPKLGRPGRKPETFELAIAGLPFVTVYRLKGDAVEVLRFCTMHKSGLEVTESLRPLEGFGGARNAEAARIEVRAASETIRPFAALRMTLLSAQGDTI